MKETKILGWTGGVGMGKSASAELLRRRNIPVIDTDVIAHDLVKLGQPALREIESAFGREVLASDGQLDRRRLAEIVFADSGQMQRLEAIMHPRIREIWLGEAGGWRKARVPLGVVVIPLLFETNAEAEFDAVVCVACGAETQNERLASRGWTSEASEQRNKSQWPIETKTRRADFVIWSEGDLQSHDEQIEQILSHCGGG